VITNNVHVIVATWEPNVVSCTNAITLMEIVRMFVMQGVTVFTIITARVTLDTLVMTVN